MKLKLKEQKVHIEPCCASHQLDKLFHYSPETSKTENLGLRKSVYMFDSENSAGILIEATKVGSQF